MAAALETSRPARLLLVDGHAYAYRAFYAIRGLKGADGRPTNAIYGFIKMLGKMMEFVCPTHLGVIWDGGLSGERTSLLPGYKTQRPPMPGDLESQLDEIQAYLSATGLRSLLAEGVEADDWIAVAARRGVHLGMDVVIASSDKDFMQLVSSRVGLLNPGDKVQRIWRDEDVASKTGVKPEQIPDWLALIGDAVDNIPGVPGVGPKTAADLLGRFQSLDGIYAHLGEVPSERLRKQLEACRDVVSRNLAMVTLPEALPVECDVASWLVKAGHEDLERLRQLFERWSFRSMLEEIRKKQGVGQQEMF